MSATKKLWTTRAEQEKLLENFYKSLEDETFLGHAFICEGKDLNEPSSSSVGNDEEESIATVEETETNIQKEDADTLEQWLLLKKTSSKNFGWSSQWSELWWAATTNKGRDNSGEEE